VKIAQTSAGPPSLTISDPSRFPLQGSKPENYFTVREALIQAGRADLIGDCCDCLIGAQALKEAIEARRRQTNNAVRGDHYHSVANPATGEKPGERGTAPPKLTGNRPGRKSATRRKKTTAKNGARIVVDKRSL
jgi:Domain of unknown function (DUF3362)